jgi:hypothetical protein
VRAPRFAAHAHETGLREVLDGDGMFAQQLL